MQSSKLFYCLTFLLLAIGLNIVVAQKGSDCEFDGDCRDSKQWCSFGYCRCKDGLIQHDKSCYNATYYGQPCVDEAQCQGLFCYPRLKGGLSRCLCGKFGVYNKTTEVCDYDFGHLETLREQEDNKGRIESEANFIFYYVVIAGCLAMSLMTCVGFSAILYCIYMKHEDEKLKIWITKAEADRPKNLTTGNINKDGKNEAMHTMDVPDMDMDAGMSFDM